MTLIKPALLTREFLEAFVRGKIKPEGEPVPRWYTWTYYDFQRDVHVYYPIGISLLVQLYRNIRIFFKFWLPHQFGKQSYETYLYKKGYQDGLYDRHHHKD